MPQEMLQVGGENSQTCHLGFWKQALIGRGPGQNEVATDDSGDQMADRMRRWGCQWQDICQGRSVISGLEEVRAEDGDK